MPDTIDIASLHALEVRVLRAFQKAPEFPLSDPDLVSATGLVEGQVRRAVEWLVSKALLGVTAERTESTVSLTESGMSMAAAGGPPETVLLARAAQGPVTLKDLQTDARFDRGDWGSAFGGLKKAGIIGTDGPNILIADQAGAAFYTRTLMDELFGRLADGTSSDFAGFSEPVRTYIQENAKKRGKSDAPVRLEERVVRTYALTGEGRAALTAVVERNLTGDEVSRLTPELLQSGQWKSLSFRRYDLSIKPPRLTIGRHHPYRVYLDGVRRRLLGLGFEEMKGPLVETEFWNMDALYMPQFHAARNIHDAYFIQEPSRSRAPEEPYVTNVGRVHRDGGDTGSRGWRYPFDPHRSRRLLMRTQGTALSARALASDPNIPGKYFAIARCFRPDEVDATHGAEFIQVEGIVLGESITFRSLLGLLKVFALEIAQSDDVRYVPDYFPFTEPSVELQARHPKLGWIELGGAGLFRPELTNPLGVTVPVIAWGLGIDRMAMVALGVHDIRDLFSADLDYIRNQK